MLLHLKRPSGSVNSVHHSPGMCVRFLQRRALVCVCWSVDGVSSDCSDKHETQAIGLCASPGNADEQREEKGMGQY